MSGSIKSRMMASGFSVRATASPSRPLPATATLNPSNSRASSAAPITICGSSSTTRIVFFAAAMSGCASIPQDGARPRASERRPVKKSRIPVPSSRASLYRRRSGCVTPPLSSRSRPPAEGARARRPSHCNPPLRRPRPPAVHPEASSPRPAPSDATPICTSTSFLPGSPPRRRERAPLPDLALRGRPEPFRGRRRPAGAARGVGSRAFVAARRRVADDDGGEARPRRADEPAAFESAPRRRIHRPYHAALRELVRKKSPPSAGP